MKIGIIAVSLGLMMGSAHGQLPEGDAERGRKVFWQCRSCHYPEQGLPHNNGPSLWDIFNKPVGKQPGFDYSESLARAQFSWSPAVMDVWLQDPSKFLPGNKMMARPIPSAQDRADLIAYLQRFSADRSDSGQSE